MSLAKAPKRSAAVLDPRLSRFLTAVTNPFAGPLTKGLVADRMIGVTNVIRRTNTFQVNIPSTTTDIDKGVEFLIILNGERDPYLLYSVGGTSAITALGRDPDAVANYTIPLNSYGRVVAAGARFTYMGQAMKLSGAVYQFPTDKGGGGATGLAGATAFGQVRDQLERALTRQQVRMKPMHFVNPPEEQFSPITAIPDTKFSTGILPTAADRISCMHFFWTGDRESCNFTVEVSSMIEYYHISHKAFATRCVPHPVGDSVQQALASTMQQPSANMTNPAEPGFMARLKANVIEAAGMLGVVANTAVGLKQAYNMLGASNSAPLIEEVGTGALAIAL